LKVADVIVFSKPNDLDVVCIPATNCTSASNESNKELEDAIVGSLRQTKDDPDT
jgi:hypothetical protein